jgi:fused signal recognition particle receptor
MKKRRFFMDRTSVQCRFMFSFFRSKAKTPPVDQAPVPPEGSKSLTGSDSPSESNRQTWFGKLKAGLKKTGGGLAAVFTGTQIDEALYEELETALLMADTGVKATEHLLKDLKARVKASKATEPIAVKALLIDAITDLLLPLQKQLHIGDQKPMVIMVAGVNGAGQSGLHEALTRWPADRRRASWWW